MRIWVDADACPGAIKDIVTRAAMRVGIELVLVANQPLRVPASRHVRTVQVPRGFDEADRRIAAELRPGDLVVTADIPLAAEVVRKGALALNPNGELYTEENVRERLAMRNLMDQLRSNGMIAGGPPPPGKKERERFANQLDKLLARAARA
jgi:uncharacterized protein YaiI (UPF0178 family)